MIKNQLPYIALIILTISCHSKQEEVTYAQCQIVSATDGNKMASFNSNSLISSTQYSINGSIEQRQTFIYNNKNQVIQIISEDLGINTSTLTTIAYNSQGKWSTVFTDDGGHFTKDSAVYGSNTFRIFSKSSLLVGIDTVIISPYMPSPLYNYENGNYVGFKEYQAITSDTCYTTNKYNSGKATLDIYNLFTGYEKLPASVNYVISNIIDCGGNKAPTSYSYHFDASGDLIEVDYDSQNKIIITYNCK